MITKLDDLLELVKTKGKKRLVVAYANDDHTVCAASAAVDKGIVDATLVGDIETIKKSAPKRESTPTSSNWCRRPTTTRPVPRLSNWSTRAKQTF